MFIAGGLEASGGCAPTFRAYRGKGALPVSVRRRRLPTSYGRRRHSSGGGCEAWALVVVAVLLGIVGSSLVSIVPLAAILDRLWRCRPFRVLLAGPTSRHDRWPVPIRRYADLKRRQGR